MPKEATVAVPADLEALLDTVRALGSRGHGSLVIEDLLAHEQNMTPPECASFASERDQ
jgi:hypothetical protein